MKHVGRIKTNRHKAIVAYRTIPNDPYNALVILTENLNAADHDDLIKVVESAAGQDEYELATALARSYFIDGRNMLSALHREGQLRKFGTNEIEMIPDSNNTISLDELNQIIANQRGVSLEDLAISPDAAPSTQTQVQQQSSPPVQQTQTTTQNDVMSDEDLAKSLRSQADAMFKEAKALRDQAEELVPTKKRIKKQEVVG